MSYYQEGCDLWAWLGLIVLSLSFITYESAFRLSAHTKIAFAKPFSVLLPGVAEVPRMSGSSGHLNCNS